MLSALNTPEIYRLALVIGALVAVHYKDRYGIIPGGIMIPGFIIVLFILSPIWCLTSLSLSFVVYFIYKRFLDRTGYKRRTPMYILGSLSIAIASILELIYRQLGWLNPSLEVLFGSLMPAIIAFTFTRQNIKKVVQGIAISTGLTAFILLIIYLIGTQILNADFNTIRPLYAGLEPLRLKYHIVQFYIALGAGYLIYHFQNVRSGGYMVSPIAAVLLLQPVSAILFLLGCFIVYWITQWICELTLTVGLKRYALVLFLSTIFVWGTELLVAKLDFTILPFQGSNFFVIIALLSYVNDGILYGYKNILPCMILTIAISTTTIIIIDFLSILLV